jgi:hypothetical protein
MGLTQDKLKELLHYDPETGIFRWRYSVANRVKPWDVAGTLVGGYISISIKSVPHGAHRLAWLYMTGKLPLDKIDHINGDVLNNCWSNLRQATNKQNAENCALYQTNTSGFRGVSFDKTRGKWLASVTHYKKQICLGRFKTAEEAAQAAAAKRAELFTHDTGRDQVNTFA